MSHKSGFRTPHACLGVPLQATESEIRAAYRTLALIYHPDKASSLSPEAAASSTARFQELNTAYKLSLANLLRNDAEVEVCGWEWEWEYDAELDNDVEVNTPAGEIPIVGVAWWDRLTTTEEGGGEAEVPAEILAWANACKKAHRNSRRAMTHTERVILDLEYRAAYDAYEIWRREGERRSTDKSSGDGYVEVDAADESACYEGWDFEDESRLRHSIATGTWRDNTANKASTKRQNQNLLAASKNLENFRRQTVALADRNRKSNQNSDHTLYHQSPAQGSISAEDELFPLTGKHLSAQRSKTKARKVTEARLQKSFQYETKASLEVEVERKLAIADKQARKNGLELDYRDVKGVRSTAGGLFRGAKVGAKKEPVIEDVPECWEDEVE